MWDHWEETFKVFTTPGQDRFRVLQNLLEHLGLESRSCTIASATHLILGPGTTEPLVHKNPTVLIAHYDCVEGSPGANDNGAAVFALIETARQLKKEGVPDWYIIFTDKEERIQGSGYHSQGAYTLSLGLKSIGLQRARYFIFDVCGRGDTLIVSTTLDKLLAQQPQLRKKSLHRATVELRQRALEAAQHIGYPHILLVPTPFSDDLGFAATGIAAQTITVLPCKEANTLLQHMRRSDTSPAGPSTDKNQRTAYPETWHYINSALDTVETLTPDILPVISRFAYALCLRS